MRCERDIRECREGRRNPRLVGIDIEARAAEPALLQGSDEFRFAYDRAASNVYQKARRAERIQHRPPDEVLGRRAARNGNDQSVARVRQIQRRGVIRVGHLLRPPRGIGDAAAEPFQPPRNGLPDPAETNDTVAPPRHF
jgi:hypothetical protein